MTCHFGTALNSTPSSGVGSKSIAPAHGAEPRYVVMDGAAYFVLRFVMGKGEEHVQTVHGLTIIAVPVSQMLVVVGEPWEEAARPFQRRKPGGAPN
jgi:hypothetical protein